MDAQKTLSRMLGFNAGYVDTAGFLALGGLFTAHVTGNFVTLGASLVHHGSEGALSKLSALPVFCAAVVLSRMASNALVTRQRPPLYSLVVAKILLLVLAAGLMIGFGPFLNADAPLAFVAGMSMVCAMAVQNAMHRMHLSQLPPSTLMTGNTTQVMIDLADLLKNVQGEARGSAVARLKKMVPSILYFASGCALAALGYLWLGMWCFALPPVVALISLAFLSPTSA
ncbi:DUF1275 domain-containing protein [Comamonas testosteroni]|uniref:DUF1275 domain-containing protein n=1 Tax=Comamonas testosteroni TaxID=285 RepID=A0A373FKW1_COMTE|nr:YoaK family protein [Comamonas testosteroni]RGE44821.1 DUF1275 domain-containing protein [Comamonas testosteroni]